MSSIDLQDKYDECSSGRIVNTMKSCLIQNKSPLLIIIATIIGFGVGIALRAANLQSDIIEMIGFPGVIMLRAFSMILVPLLCCSIILGISSMGEEANHKLAALTLVFFFGLSLVSAVIGVVGGHMIPAIEDLTENADQEIDTTRKSSISDSILDLLRNSIPNNIMQATFMQEYTDVLRPEKNITLESSTPRRSIQFKYGVNYIGLLIFCVICGSAMTKLTLETAQLKLILHQINLVILKVLSGLVKLVPLGMFFWMCQEGLLAKSPGAIFAQLGQYVGIGLMLLMIHHIILLPTLYLLIVRESPVKFHKNILPALFTAFGTTSSAVTLPVTLKCMEEKNLIHRTVTRFVLPLGMVIHMNGSTMYHSMATIFVARLEKNDVTVTDSLMVIFMAFLLLIAAPAIPSCGSPVLILTLLSSIGIEKPNHLAVILIVDWLMERVRTSSNVLGDCYVAAYVEKLCWEQLEPDISIDNPLRYTSISDGPTEPPMEISAL